MKDCTCSARRVLQLSFEHDLLGRAWQTSALGAFYGR